MAPVRFAVALVALGALLAASAQARAEADSVTTGVAGGQFIQWTSGDSGSASISTTYQNQRAGNGNLILAFSHWDNQKLTAEVSDNAGNKYVSVSGPLNAGPTDRFQLWYARNIKGGVPLAVTVKYSGTTTSFSLVDVAEYAGLDRAAPLDAFASATGTGSFQDSGPTRFTTSPNETVVGFFGFSRYALPYKAGPGFTSQAYDGSSFMEDRSVAALGSYRATAMSNRPDSWAAFVTCFKNATQP
jgi:hypothetical protein